MMDPRYRWYRVELTTTSAVYKEDGKFKYGTRAFVFRCITAGEHRISQDMDEEEGKLYVLRHCAKPEKAVDGYIWENELYGSSEMMLKVIYRASGLDEDMVTYQDAKEWWDSPLGKMEWMAVGFIPSCNFEHLYSCEQFLYARYLLSGQMMFELTTRQSANDFINGIWKCEMKTRR